MSSKKIGEATGKSPSSRTDHVRYAPQEGILVIGTSEERELNLRD